MARTAVSETLPLPSGEVEGSMQPRESDNGKAGSVPPSSPVPSSPVRLRRLSDGIITMQCLDTKRAFAIPPARRQYVVPSFQPGGSTRGLSREAAIAASRVSVSLGQGFVHRKGALPLSFVHD